MDVLIAVIRREHDDARLRKLGENRGGGVESVHHRHHEIHQYHIRARLAITLDRFFPIRCFGDDTHPGLSAQYRGEPCSNQRVVVDTQDGDLRVIRHARFYERRAWPACLDRGSALPERWDVLRRTTDVPSASVCRQRISVRNNRPGDRKPPEERPSDDGSTSLPLSDCYKRCEEG